MNLLTTVVRLLALSSVVPHLLVNSNRAIKVIEKQSIQTEQHPLND